MRVRRVQDAAPADRLELKGTRPSTAVDGRLSTVDWNRIPRFEFCVCSLNNSVEIVWITDGTLIFYLECV
jgi:hypothetical protein